MRKTFIWWAQFIGVLALPFLLVPGMWVAALLVPGMVKVDDWSTASTFVFLAATIPVVVLLFRSKFHWIARSALAIFTIALLCFAAFTMQVRSTCGDEPVLIGLKPNHTTVVSCK